MAPLRRASTWFVVWILACLAALNMVPPLMEDIHSIPGTKSDVSLSLPPPPSLHESMERTNGELRLATCDGLEPPSLSDDSRLDSLPEEERSDLHSLPEEVDNDVQTPLENGLVDSQSISQEKEEASDTQNRQKGGRVNSCSLQNEVGKDLLAQLKEVSTNPQTCRCRSSKACRAGGQGRGPGGRTATEGRAEEERSSPAGFHVRVDPSPAHGGDGSSDSESDHRRRGEREPLPRGRALACFFNGAGDKEQGFGKHR